MRRRSCLVVFLVGSSILALLLLLAMYVLPSIAETTFGPPSPTLSRWQVFRYSVDLLWHSSDMTIPHVTSGEEILFVIEPGEDASSVSTRLERAGLIPDARIFRIYLVWSGMDAYIQAGTFRLNPSLSAESIAEMLQTTMLTEIFFSVLPGWRIEEVAATLPTSGLSIEPDEFLAAASSQTSFPDLLPPGTSVEGFLFPDVYILPRTTTPGQLISVLVQGFFSHVTNEYMNAFATHGLTLHEAVTLASIIEREAVVEDEMPLIASVFYNRLAIGMKLQTDPTIQYALGYNVLQETWWTTPLSVSDLGVESPYNTYLYPGLPPGPIANPGLAALGAVADPALSPYYYFQAKCDGSGFHNFSETLEQHELNNCP